MSSHWHLLLSKPTEESSEAASRGRLNRKMGPELCSSVSVISLIFPETGACRLLQNVTGKLCSVGGRGLLSFKEENSLFYSWMFTKRTICQLFPFFNSLDSISSNSCKAPDYSLPFLLCLFLYPSLMST